MLVMRVRADWQNPHAQTMSSATEGVPLNLGELIVGDYLIKKIWL
jgi:hypothetical protein